LAFGFKSAIKSNLQVLQSLRERFSEEVLVAAGLWKWDGGRCRPEPQLYGWGNTGKKDERGDLIWGWVYPILIPYFDETGEVVAIRPHKGNTAGRPGRLFVARFVKGSAERLALEQGTNQPRPAICVVTEGEFKACALYWVFEGRTGAAAMPGISQSKNYSIMEELKKWLRDQNPTEGVVVAFDSEQKGDPALPGFKPDRRKRFESEIWARYRA
jgi:hypothetical protein